LIFASSDLYKWAALGVILQIPGLCLVQIPLMPSLKEYVILTLSK